MNWHFPRMADDQVESEVTQRDQFDNDDVGISETLVREAVQNSLDAAVGDPPVRVTFRFETPETISAEFFRTLFERQLTHAKAAGLELDSLDFDAPSALVIEDFGTSGLTGSTQEKDDDNFSDFWRRHGKSHKSGKSRGRWGLGKLVYSISSRLGVFFGVTERAGDITQHLMGQTVLNVVRTEDAVYLPHAYFCDINNPEDHFKRIPVPIQDESIVDEFSSNFGLKRAGHPGLSVVIPFPGEQFTVESMIGSAIDNYFFPIITGQLVLAFDDVEINSDNVRELAHTHATDRFHHVDIDTLFDFIEEFYKAEQTELLVMKPSWQDDKVLDEDDFDPDDLIGLRDTFARGEMIGVHLPVTLKPKEKDNIESHFHVYIKRPPDLQRGLDLYVRGGLTLPGESKFRDRRALGALIAEEEQICGFLGDAENAAHTLWTSHTEKLNKNWRGSQTTVTLIKKAVVQLYDLLAEVTEEKSEDALLNFFWFDQPDTGRDRRRTSPREPNSVPRLTPPPSLFSINKVQSGFTLAGTDALSEEDLPCELKIEVAYDTSRGNPFSRYSTLDFRAGRGGNVEISTKSKVSVISTKGNSWQFSIEELPFRMTIKGFDANRDLRIRTSPS